jgi:phosphatidylserine decarboxylase
MPNRSSFIAREGFLFIIPLAGITVLTAVVGMPVAAGLFFLLTAFNLWFFRNPERPGPSDTGSIVSPADGRVIKIEQIDEPDLIGTKCIKISIFMNIFDVHVNRIPFSGIVEKIVYRKGAFVSADLDKASEKNERNIVLLKTDDGRQLLFIQIAGLIARRIVCWIEEGLRVKRGERFGMICFGSRVELFLPVESRVTVKVGDRVKAGTTIMGCLP